MPGIILALGDRAVLAPVEYIIPNSEEYRRESQLYVDIAAYEDGEPVWSTPIATDGITSGHFMPASLQIIDALATAELWGRSPSTTLRTITMHGG